MQAYSMDLRERALLEKRLGISISGNLDSGVGRGCLGGCLGGAAARYQIPRRRERESRQPLLQ